MRPFAELLERARGVQGRLVAVMIGPPLVPVLLALGCALIWGVGVVRHARHELVAQRATALGRSMGQWVRQALDLAPTGTPESLRVLGVLATAWVDGAGGVRLTGGILTDAGVFADAGRLAAQEGTVVAGPLRSFPVPGVVVGLREGDGLRCLFLDLAALGRWLDSARQADDHAAVLVEGGRVERGPAPEESWERASASVPGLPWQVELAAAEDWTLSAERWLALFLAVVLVAGGLVVVGLALRTSGAVARLIAQYDAQHSALRDALSRAELLAQLGSMAAGFAHEINNPLQVMKSEQSYMRLLLDSVLERCPQARESASELQESMRQLEGQIQRCSRITHAILGFGRLSAGEPHVVDLCRFVPEVVSTFRSMADAAGAGLEVTCAAEAVLVRLDPAKLQQVLANLLSNAIHAVEGRAGARVAVTVRAEAERAVIGVEDNGCGIAPEHREAIFTPFFTTKGPDKGTGLGLPICLALVQALEGTMDFDSEVGQGTRFVVTLPRLAPAR